MTSKFILYLVKVWLNQIKIVFSSNILLVANTDIFSAAINMLKELKEKYTPMAMLTVIENCMEKITDAYQTISNSE